MIDPSPGAADARLTVGVDVGGTKVLAGVVDSQGRVLDRALRETPTDSEGDLVRAVVDLVESFRQAWPVHGVGLAVAGFVNRDGSLVRFSPHLPLRESPLRDLVTERVGLPVLVENDATAATLAEHRFGAARGRRHVLGITVGTGIGGGVVVDGRLHRGMQGMAGEPGHMPVVPDGLPCPCGGRGCWEQYASGSALVRLASGRSVRSTPAVVRGGLAAPEPEAAIGPAVTTAALDGDETARELLAEIGGWLGHGLAGLVAVLDPDCVVVGGGVAAAGELLLGPARTTLRDRLVGAAHREPPTVVPASLGADAAFVGAAHLAGRPAPASPGAARG